MASNLRKSYDDNWHFMERCEEQIALVMRRDKIVDDLNNLQQMVIEVYHEIVFDEDKIKREAEDLIKVANTENKKIIELTQRILKLKQQQLEKSLALKKEEEEQLKNYLHPANLNEITPLKPCLSKKSTSISKSNSSKVVAFQKPPSQCTNKMLTQNTLTPIISIADYKSSPLVKQKVPRNLMFMEFQVQLNQSHFNKISGYMRGRETLADLNQFLEGILIPCFNEKYQLLHRERCAVRKPQDMELWNLYNAQASLFPGRHFITPGDITRKINKMLDKKLLNRLTILRHIGLLQEKHVSQTTCYLFNSNFV